MRLAPAFVTRAPEEPCPGGRLKLRQPSRASQREKTGKTRQWLPAHPHPNPNPTSFLLFIFPEAVLLALHRPTRSFDQP